MRRLVFDTNVVLDCYHFADPAALPLREALEAGHIVALADAATLDELARVVTYPEFRLTPAEGEALLARYRALVYDIPLGPSPALPRCQDPDDQKFLELAARGGADCLVSKDKALLRLRRKQGLAFRIDGPAGAVAYLSEISNTPR